MYIYIRVWRISENNNFGSEINSFRNIAFGKKSVLVAQLAPDADHFFPKSYISETIYFRSKVIVLRDALRPEIYVHP